MRNISTNEICTKVLDTFCGNGGVILSLESTFGTVIVPYTENLQISETGDKLLMQDDNDISISINRSSICNSTVSGFEATDEQIELDLGDTKLSLILCSY